MRFIKIQKCYLNLLEASFMLLLLSCLLAACNDSHAAGPSLPISGSSEGSIGTALTTPDTHLKITLLSQEKNGANYLFHFSVQNTSNQDVQLIGTGATQQFLITLPKGAYAKTHPTTSLQSTTYIPLPTGIAAGKTADGWVMIDSTTIPSTPSQIMYAFGQVSMQACTKPGVASTCKPATLYQSLLWDF